MAGKGDLLPVSAFPVDGTWPTGTSRWEKRTIAAEVPIWDPKSVSSATSARWFARTPPSVPRFSSPTTCTVRRLTFSPPTYKAAGIQGLEVHDPGVPQDCTGCNLCVAVCPAKDKIRSAAQGHQHGPCWPPVLEEDESNYDFFLDIPDPPRDRVSHIDVKSSQFFLPLFEYSGACPGCGETPYIKLLTQLFGDRLADCQRDRLLVDLRRQSADHALHRQRRGPRARLVELALRGQRRVWARAAGWASTT